jgi:hypothetical protein
MMGRPITRVPLVLGVAGLLPFAFLAMLVVTGWHDQLGWSAPATRAALLTYGAIIASFLGGIRWGLALGESGRRAALDYALAVLPSLLAWGALLLPGPGAPAALALLIGGWGFVDQDLVRRGVAPPWFGQLRAMLSAGAGLSLLAAALA